MTNSVKIATSVDDRVSGPLDKIRAKIDGLDTGSAKFGAVAGVAGGIAAGAFGLVEGAAQDVVGAMGDVVRAGLEGEASQRRLETSLKANVPAWDGTTTAIERHIQANLRLGFSDDEQRDSLAKLVAATHDIGKAYDVQNVAMDLARFKGISLGDATDALTKVQAGSYRILKSLGIELANNATQADALAAVEKVASGQAEAFANTTEGKLAAAQAHVGDVMEKLGEHILPLVGSALEGVAEIIDPTSRSFQKFAHDAEGFGGVITGNAQVMDLFRAKAKELGVSVDVLYQRWQDDSGNLDQAVHELQTGVGTAFSDMGQHAGKLADDFGLGVRQINASTSSMDTHIGKLKDDVFHAKSGIVSDFGDIGYAALQARDDMLTAATDEVHKYFDVVRAQDSLTADNAQIAAAKRVLASKTASAAEKHDAQTTLDQATADRADALATIAGAGASTSKTFTATMKTLNKELQTAHGDEKTAITAEIVRLQLLDAQAAISNGKMLTLEQTIVATLAKGGYVQNIGSTPGKPAPSKPSSGGTSGGTNKGPSKYAAGGHYAADEPRIVGEYGIELDIPDHSGTIIPNNKLRSAVRSGWSMSSGDTFNIHLHGLTVMPTPGQTEQLVATLGPAIRRVVGQTRAPGRTF